MKGRLAAASLFLVFVFASSSAAAEGALSVLREAEINASPQELWGVVGGFGDWHNWHPAVAASELSGDGTRPGDKRVLTLGDGGKIHETLEAWDAAAMRCSYTITESPLPVANYHSTISVEPVEGGKSRLSWTSSFDAAGVSDEEAVAVIAGVYEAGIDALEAHFGSR